MQQGFATSLIGLAVILLAGCAQSTPAPSGPPRLATSTEALHALVPPDMRLGLHRTGGGFEVAEYVPASQTMADWSDLFAATVLARQPGITLPQLVAQQQEGAVQDCTLPPAATAPSEVTDGGLPAVAQGIACGRNKATGQGEITVIKTVLGASAVFQIQRSYRLPPVAASATLRLPPGAEAEVTARLQQSFVCSVANPEARCK